MTQHPTQQPQSPNPAAAPVSAPAPVLTDESRAERGSALVVSMMIMVILTMLGVTFAVLATQEEKISVNARDHQQTLYAAEAAIEIARTWFNDPSTSTNSFKPTDGQMKYTLRRGKYFHGPAWTNADELADAVAGTNATDIELDGSAGSVYTGGNMGGGASRFDKPFRGSYSNSFWGRQGTPDVLLCGDATLDVDADGAADCTGAMRNYMDKLNRSLSMSATLRSAGHSSRDVGTLEIEQIRVYRPPLDFDLMTRYGVATVEATAIKRVRNQIVSRRTVREVLQEIPFPGPGGAIESEGEISASGSAGVHWGSVVSASTSDDITLPGTNANFPDTSVARLSPARWGFHWTINPAAFTNHGGTGTAYNGGAVIATFLTEALGITKEGEPVGNTASPPNSAFAPPGIGDPWLLFRARRSIIIPGETLSPTTQPCPWTAGDGGIRNGPEFDKGVELNWSHMFQSQIVRFPPIDYQTWKDVSQSGAQGMHYFKWDAGVNYRRDGIGAAASWTSWLDTYDRGVFFFDTRDSSKPLEDESNLTPTHGWATNMYVEGFVYLNAATFDSSGAGNGTTKACNMPGEVFLDDGIDLHAPGDTVGDDCLCIRYDSVKGCVLGVHPIGYVGVGFQCGPADKYGDSCQCPLLTIENLQADTDQHAISFREAETFRNGIWDSDIDNDGFSDAASDITTLSGWANFISTNDGANEGFTGGHGYGPGVLPGYPKTRRYRQGQVTGAAGQTDWKRDPRFLNHITEAGWNASVGRQVHEPFLNFDLPGNTINTWANSHSVKVDYRADTDPVERDSGGTITRRMTRARDATGALMNLDLHFNGVFYCEGLYTGTGNLNVYGSLLMRGGYAGTGDVNVWFNEDLVKGKFPSPSWKLPRVYASARDTN